MSSLVRVRKLILAVVVKHSCLGVINILIPFQRVFNNVEYSLFTERNRDEYLDKALLVWSPTYQISDHKGEKTIFEQVVVCAREKFANSGLCSVRSRRIYQFSKRQIWL